MRNFLNLFCCLLSVSVALCQDISISQVPNWVVEVRPPLTSEVSKYDVNAGYYYKLIDYQVNMEKDTYYRHFVENVLTSGGVSNVSQLQLTYDSSYQRIIFHDLRIHRAGKILDRTSQVSFEYIKNEQQLQSSIYTGEVTALVVLNDIRKGDMVEFSYSITGSNPVFKQNRSHLIPINDVNPIDQMFVRVLYPKDENYGYRTSSKDIKIEESIVNDMIELRSDRKNLSECKIEDSMVPWIIPYDYLEISNTKNWKEVNDWALQLFSEQADDEISKIFDEIFYPEYTLEDKINSIIDFVQDEIRYMGIESGIGSIMPFSPNKVVQQRFGDCKDKSLLLVSMLRKVGIDKSYPALVNSILLGEISSHIPSGYLFDHCIVNFQFEGNEFWIDPTYSYQGGTYASTQTFSYGKALVVKEGTTELTDIGNTEKVSSSFLEEYLDASSFENPASLTAKTTFTGSRADYTRQILEYYSLRELSEFYKYSYSQVFPTIREHEKMKVADDMSSNQLVSNESYMIPNIWNEKQEGYEGKRTITYNPISVYSYVGATSCEEKTYPVFMAHPFNYKQVTEIEFPEAIALQTDEKKYDNVAFTFTKKQESLSSTKVRLSYHFISKVNSVSPTDFPEVCSDINEIVDGLPIIFYFSKTFDLSQLDMDYFDISVTDIPLSTINQEFYIADVKDESKNFNGIVGIVNTQKKDRLTGARVENGAQHQLKSYLLSEQKKYASAKPVTLTIKQLLVSEKNLKKSTPTARLEFDYRISFTENDIVYTYRFIDNIESSGSDLLEQHNHNLQTSLEKLIRNIQADKFERSD